MDRNGARKNARARDSVVRRGGRGRRLSLPTTERLADAAAGFDHVYVLRPNRSVLGSVQSTVALVHSALLAASGPAPEGYDFVSAPAIGGGGRKISSCLEMMRDLSA